MFLQSAVATFLLLLAIPMPAFAESTQEPASGRFRPLRVIDADDGKLQCVQFSPDGKSVAACGDRFVQMFDLESGKLVRKFEGHTADIFRFAFSPDGRYVASGSRDKTVHVWHVPSGEVAAVLDAHTDRIIGVNFSADSRWLASASANYDGTIRVWDCTKWQQRASVKAPYNTNAMYLAFSPDGKFLATSEYRGGVRLYAFDETALVVRHEMNHDGGEMTPHVTFVPDGKAFLTSSWDKTIRLWDVETGRQIWKRRSPPYARCFEASVYSPDGSTIYSVTRDETIQARDAKTGKLKRTRRWNDEVRGLAIHPDGSLLATSGHRGDIKIWSVQHFD